MESKSIVYYKALANEKRLAIVNLLNNGSLAVNDIVESLGYRQSNISQHLTQLRKAGLIIMKRKGKRIYYRLAQ